VSDVNEKRVVLNQVSYIIWFHHSLSRLEISLSDEKVAENKNAGTNRG